MFYQGVLVSFVALVAFSYAGQKLGAPKAGLFAILTPVSGVIFSSIFLQEVISFEIYLALLVMISGMTIGLVPTRVVELSDEEKNKENF